tara:strand:- start:215 stop:430 length:216 start_codon:yes stop_codon:yes gene_type:complete
MLCAVGCTKSWTEEEKNDFITDCIKVNGIETTCLCVLGCLETEYGAYEEAINNIEKKELSKECRACLEQCE